MTTVHTYACTHAYMYMPSCTASCMFMSMRLCMMAGCMTGGMITTVPTSVEEAKQLGKDLVQNEGGKMLSKMTGAF